MNKTIEEKRSSVLAYCEEVCPRNGHQHPLYEGAYLRGDIDGYGIYHYWGGLKGGNSTCICSISTRSTSAQIAEFRAFYALLGLETRDALEAYKASLQSDLKSMTAIVSSVKKGEQPDYVHISKITELQSRNTALVVALDELTNGIGNVQFMYNSYLQYKDSANAFNLSRSIGELVRAKAKFKNELLALSANTEKGGVQG